MLDRLLATHFAFARVHRVMSLSYLQGQEAHARRLVPTAELRPRMHQAASLFWSAFGSPNGEFVADYRKMRGQLGARERRGAALCLHMLIGVSPGWVERMGDLHDPRNIRVQQLFQVVRAFCDRHFNGVFAVRMDLDERGGAVVDVFATHAHERKARLRKNGGRGPSVTELSVRSVLDEMSRLSGAQKSYSALQTLWAEFARDQLDRGIVRGVPKKVTGREHLSTPEFRQVAEREHELAEQRRGLMVTLANTYPVIEEVARNQELRDLDQDEREVALKRRDLNQSLREDAVAERSRDVNEREQLIWQREQAATVKESRLAEFEAETERVHAYIYRRATDLEVSIASADRMAAHAEQRAAEADAAAARYAQHHRQLDMGLSMMAKGILDRDHLESWPEVQEIRPLLENAFLAVDIRTANEQRALNNERQSVAARDYELDRRDAELVARRTRLDDEQKDGTARSNAYTRAIAQIASGQITSPGDILADSTLAPAADLIAVALDGVVAATIEVRLRLVKMQADSARVLNDAKATLATAAERGHAAEFALAEGERRHRVNEAEAGRLAADRHVLDRYAAAWRVGMAEITVGRMRSVEDIEGRHDLAPAAADLIRVKRALDSRVEQRSRQAAAHLAAAGVERGRLAKEREQARDAHCGALELKCEAERQLGQAEAALADAKLRAVTANRMRANLTVLLSSVSALVTTVASRTDIPAALRPPLKALIHAHRTYMNQKGRGLG